MDYSKKKTVEDIDVAGKKVLVRCDFNVPLDENGNITDTKRIDEAMKTINYLVSHNAKVILCSHLGRPKGEVNMKYSLKPVAAYLSKKLGFDVKMASDVVGDSAKAIAADLKDGEVELLENVRFEKGETKNDPELAKAMASLAEIYVNDAFGTAHRAHASTAGVADYLPAVCGYLIQKEISVMGTALSNPKRPFVAILGGAKVSDKIGVINNLLEKVDTLIIGGGMAYTFMNALGYSIGTSICEADKVELAKDMMAKAKDKGVKFLIPVDNRVGDKYAPDCNHKLVNSDNIPDGWMGLDIGPKTEALFADAIKGAGTVVWNGPMGVSEWDNFASGTIAVAKAVAESGAISIIGGGDSAAAVEKLGFADKMTHISTGGGASLEFLEGLVLPGIACLLDICRAVEAVVADDRLGHSHFTSFLDDESAFLIEACNSDDIRISCLNLCQLCREVCIFISESFSIYDIDAQLLEYVLINLVFADHLVIVVGVHDSNGLEAKLVISFLYSNRNCEFAWDSITENVVAKIGDARSCGAGTKGNDLGLLGNGTCSKHFARCHRTFNSEDFILFNALLDSIDCFSVVQLGIVSYEIDLHLCLRIFVDFFDSEINAFLHSLAVSCAGACICSYKSEFNCLSCCAALGSFLVSAASCKGDDGSGSDDGGCDFEDGFKLHGEVLSIRDTIFSCKRFGGCCRGASLSRRFQIPKIHTF